MILIKFWAEWCGPCKQQGKLLEELDEIKVESIDIEDEENQEMVDLYRVQSLPTLVLVNDEGYEVKRFIGLTPVNKIKEAIKEYNK